MILQHKPLQCICGIFYWELARQPWWRWIVSLNIFLTFSCLYEIFVTSTVIWEKLPRYRKITYDPGHITNKYYSIATISLRQRNWPRLPRTWWRHQMETFSAFLAICTGDSPVSGEFPAQRPVTRSFDVFFDLYLNKRLSKHWWGWWLETPSWSLCSQCNENKGYAAIRAYSIILDPGLRHTLGDLGRACRG